MTEENPETSQTYGEKSAESRAHLADSESDHDLWEETKAKLLKTADALGMPIDEGIIDTIIGLNANGFDTSASCEGHLDWGLPYPWVEMAVDDETTQKLLEKIFELSDTIHDMTSEKDAGGGDNFKNTTGDAGDETRTTTEKADALDGSDISSDDSESSSKAVPAESEEIKKLYAKRARTERELEVVREERRRPIRELLAEFYKHRRPARYGLILHLAELDRIECIESDGQILKSLDEQIERLEEYRAEFAALADFLRERLG